MRNSYTIRLLVMVLGLVALVQAATFFAARAVIRDSEIDNSRRELGVGGEIFTELLFSRAQQLQQSTLVLVNDFGFREAIASADTGTIQSALANHAARIGADYAAVTMPDGSTVSLKGASDHPDQLLGDRRDDSPIQISLIDGQPYELVVADINAPLPIGTATMGYAMNQALTRELKQLTGLEVSFVASSREHDNIYFSSTLPDELARNLPSIYDSLKGQPGVQQVMLGKTEMMTLSWRLDRNSDPIYAVLQVPMSEVLAPFDSLSENLLKLNVIGILIALIVGAVLAGDILRPLRALAQAARRMTGGDYSAEVKVRGKNEFSELASAFNAMQNAISEREQRIMVQARQDPLTGLGNRSIARGALLRAIRSAQAKDGSCAALTIDLRRFKEVNDVFGHQAGDNLLQIVALRLLSSVKDNDEVIRLGADVFLVILSEVDAISAMTVARRICATLQQTVELQDLNLSINGHVGVALYPEHANESEELMRRSDIAMHVAKETGVQVSLYQSGTDEQHLRRLSLLRDLKVALEQDGLHMCYQPKAALLDHDYIGAEALIRWHHPKFGPQNPEEFIGIAESAGYINILTRWMLRQTIRQLGLWHQLGVPVHLSVNISAQDLLDNELPGYIADLLTSHDVTANYLCLEITESSIMQDEQQGLIMLNRFKSMGLRLSVDDFGTGFSSLSQLKRLPVDELKIDKSFILKLDESEDDVVIVRSTIELGHNMGLSVVAEGVENNASLGILGQYGCDMIQGYFLGKPMPPDDLRQWATHWRDAAQKQTS